MKYGLWKYLIHEILTLTLSWLPKSFIINNHQVKIILKLNEIFYKTTDLT